jgi:hypothetical protein
VTPEVRVAVQGSNAEEREGIVEVTTSNHGDVRASLFTAQLIYCFVTEDQWRLRESNLDVLRANQNCNEESVFFRNAEIDAQTTQTYAVPWKAPLDRSLTILAVQSYYVREDRMRLDGTSHEQESAAGCSGNVTTYRLQPDTRFKGVVQPTRLLTYDADTFYLGFEGGRLCDVEQDADLMLRLGVRIITVRRSEWLADDSPQN